MTLRLLLITLLLQSRNLISSWVKSGQIVLSAKLEETKDPYYAFDQLITMDRLPQIVGIAKAKLMHYLLNHWNEYGIRDSFIEVMKSYSGLTSETVITRYIHIWELFESGSIPDEYKDELKQKPINDLVPLINMLNSGYEPDENQWVDLVEAENHFRVSEVVREVKGTEPTDRALYYVLDKVSGILYAIKAKHKYIVGRLNMATKDDVVQQAIMRLLDKLNVKIVEEYQEEE